MLLKSVIEKERIKDSVPSSLRPLWFQLPIRKSRKELRKKLQYGEHSASSTTTTHCFSCAEQKTDWGSPLFPKPCSITALLFLLRHILLLFISLLHLITNADSAGTVLDVAVLHTGYILKKKKKKKLSSPHGSGAKAEKKSFYGTKSMRQLAFPTTLQIFFYNLAFLRCLIHYTSDLSWLTTHCF